jgi:Zn-dependent peptidase ImmA (M78 family)
MKQILFTLFILSATFFFHITAAHARSTFQGEKLDGDSLLVKKIPAADQLLMEIMEVVGLRQNFELKQAKVDNIEASISRRKRYILYNPDYINWINAITKDRWAATALLAHEVGHHLNGHTIRRSGSKPKLELEADEFAGFVLFKLGATLEQSQLVMKYIATVKPSRTHPARDARMIAIYKGWSRAAQSAENISTARH